MPPQIALVAAIGAAAATAAAAVAAGGFALIAGGALTYFAKTFVISAVAGYALQELSGADGDIGGAGAANVRGSSRIEQGAVVPKRWILGRSRVRGLTVWFRHLDERLAYVQLLSAGSIDGIERLFVNGEEVDISIDDATGVVTPKDSSRFMFTKTIETEVEVERIISDGDGDGGGRGDPADPGSERGGPGGGGSSFGGGRISDGRMIDGMENKPMRGLRWASRFPLIMANDLTKPLVSVYRGALEWVTEVPDVRAQGEGGGRFGVDGPTTPQRPPKRTTVKRKIKRNVRTPAIRITPYFKADGTEGARIREIAAETVPEGSATQDNDLEWTTEHKLNGISYVLIELEQPPYDIDVDGVNSRLFQRIPDVEMIVKGIRVRYPTGIDIDVDGDGNPDVNPDGDGLLYTTPAWTDNAAILRFWWMTVRRKIPAPDINLSWFNAARARCNEMITLSTYAQYVDDYPETVKRYTINGVLNSDDRVDAVERQFDLCWQGNVVEWDGQFLFRPGTHRAPRLTITEDDIIDHPIIRPSLPRENKTNEVFITLEQSARHDFTSHELTVDDPDAQAHEGGTAGPIRLPTTLPTLAFIQEPTACINFMHQQLLLQRASMEVDVTVMPGPMTDRNPFKFLSLIPGDRVELNLPEYGIGQGRPFASGASSVRYFRVLSNSVNPDFSVNLRLAQWPDRWFIDRFDFPPIRPRINLIPQPVPVPVSNGGVFVNHRIGQDGTVLWDAYMVFEPNIHTTFVSAESPLTNLQWAQVSNNVARFILEDPGTYTFRAYNIRSDGEVSAFITATAEATTADILADAAQPMASSTSGFAVKVGLTGT